MFELDNEKGPSIPGPMKIHALKLYTFRRCFARAFPSFSARSSSAAMTSRLSVP